MMAATFADYQARRDDIQARLDRSGAALRAIPGAGSGPMGLTPDAVKQSPAFRSARREFDSAFAELRALNGANVRRFRRELSAERDARRRPIWVKARHFGIASALHKRGRGKSGADGARISSPVDPATLKRRKERQCSFVSPAARGNPAAAISSTASGFRALVSIMPAKRRPGSIALQPWSGPALSGTIPAPATERARARSTEGRKPNHERLRF